MKATPLREQVQGNSHRSLADMLISLGVARWDVLAFTDGSGSSRGRSGGYAAVYRTHDSLFRTITGGIDSTTSQEAELRAVFELVNSLLAVRKNEQSGGILIQLVSDSRYVVDKLAALHPLTSLDTGKHTMWVGGLLEAARRGVKVAPHYVPRNQNPLMRLADRLSKVGRLANSPEKHEPMLAATLSECDKEFPLAVVAARKGKIS